MSNVDVHAKFSPSQLPRIISCPGSFRLCQLVSSAGTSKSSSYAQEGTMLHSATEDALALKMTELDQETIDKYKLDPEHVDAVNEVLDYVFAIKLANIDKGAYYEVTESQVSLAQYAEDLNCVDLEDVWGTLDYCLIYPEARHMFVIDWKYGKGVEVFPESAQLQAYALGALKKIRLHKNFDSVTTIIGQPRLYVGEKFKSYQTSPRELLRWCTSSLVPALQSATSQITKFSPSEDACRFCKAKHNCEARFNAAQYVAQNVFAQYASIPHTVNMEQLVKMYDEAKQYQAYIKAIGAFLVKSALAGASVPGHKLVAGKSNRAWKGEEQDTVSYLEARGIEMSELMLTSLMSPAQFEKKFGKKFLTDEDCKVLIEKPTGAPTLVLESDKRPPLDRSAASVFSSFVEEEDSE